MEEFSGVLVKQHVEIQGPVKRKKWNFQVYQKKSCGIPTGLVFWTWNFQGV